MERRPLKSRNTSWAKTLAKTIAGLGISPNFISVVSVVFSLFGYLFYCYASKGSPLLLIAAAATIQLRLLCNLFDGMVAVEYNKKTPMGDVYNDLPDRIADVLFILGAGLYCKDLAYATELAWLCSSLAIMTAYIRVLGTSIGTPTYFLGPMAKPHRMFLLTIASIAQPFLSTFPIIYYSLWIMMVGLVLTCLRRILAINKAKKDQV
tara:strand:- start:7338 stop:7958 length:621 start_codon:yes stop_codon:yes gene_type:complete